MAQLLDPEQGAVVADAALEEFRQQFRGEILRPADAGYDAARQIWNGMIDRRPALIARCTGVADVQRAVAFAREHDLRQPFSTGGYYINYMAEVESEERARAAYGDSYARLAALKATYDPTNFFRLNHNIEPALS